MKKLLLLTSLMFICINANAQVDTLYCNNGTIPCEVLEVNQNSIVYTYIGETVKNAIYKNAVQKIVFRSGRVQSFAELTSLKRVHSVDDYENVSITGVESEILGLFKLGEVSSKAKGTTEYSNQERVKKRAYRKLKIIAAMMGANIIYITNQRSAGNEYYSYFGVNSAETSLSGIAYSNTIPDYTEFCKVIEMHSKMRLTKTVGLNGSSSDYWTQIYDQPFTISDIRNEAGLIMINGGYRVVGFDDKGFNIYIAKKNQNINMRIDFCD